MKLTTRVFHSYGKGSEELDPEYICAVLRQYPSTHYLGIIV